MKVENYDLIVIGGGAAGLVSSKFAAGVGKKVALIEQNKIGGECTWTGCIPSKALIHLSNIAQAAKQAATLNLITDRPFDTEKIADYVQGKVSRIAQTHTPEQLKDLGITIIFGSPQFIDKNTITINGRVLKAHRFIIATGSSPAIPHIAGLDTTPFLTNQTLFEQKNIPRSLTIIGGGVIAAEMAAAFSKLGSNVTIIEKENRLLAREDEELSSMITDYYKSMGITILTNHVASQVKPSNSQTLEVSCTNQSGQTQTVETEALLIATGRTPNCNTLGLEKIGITPMKQGLSVDEYMKTSVSTVYACGDIVGPYQFSHMAEAQAIVATRNALLPKPLFFLRKKINYNNVIWTIFSDPEFASLGLNENQARTRYGRSIRVYKENFSKLDRAQTDEKTFGMAKFICLPSGKILGASILGARAGEIAQEVLLAMQNNIPFHKIHDTIHAYPTYSEIVKKASRKAYIEKLSQNIFIKITRHLLKIKR